MKCSNCGFENEPGAVVCAKCETTLNAVSQPVEPVDEIETMEPIEKNSKKGNKLFLIIPIIIVLALIIGAASYVSSASNPLNVYKASIKKVGNEIIEKSDDKKSYSISIKPTVSGTGQKDIEKLINKVSVSFNGNYNQDEKEVIFGVNTKYNNKDLLSADIQYHDEAAYIFLNNIFEKPIKIKTEDIDFDSDKIDAETTKKLVNGAVNAINKSFEKEYFSKSTETKEVNGKDTKVNAYKLTIDDKNYKKINNNMCNALLEDKDFIEAYAKVSKKTEKETKEDIKESFKSDDLDQKITFTLYTSGLFNKYVGVKIDTEDMTVEVIKNDDDNYTIVTNVSKIAVKLDMTIKTSNDNIKLKDVKDAVLIEELASSDLSDALDNVKKLDGYESLKSDLKDIYDVDIDDLIDYLKLITSYSSEIDY